MTTGPVASGEPPARLAAWLDERLRGVPPELAERIRALGASGLAGAELHRYRAVHTDADVAVAALLADAAASAVRGVVAGGCSERGAALDLLAADALVTYACEALAEVAAEGGVDALDGAAAALLSALAATVATGP